MIRGVAAEGDADRLAAVRFLLNQANVRLDSDPGEAARCISDAMKLLSAEQALMGRSNTHLSSWQVQKFRTVVELRFAERLTIGAVAAEINASPERLRRAVRAAYGLSFQRYLLGQRLVAAKVQMVSTVDTLACIALDCGFADQAHLSRAFRALEGTSPAVWRRSQVLANRTRGLHATRAPAHQQASS